jgi:trans-2,3-dihydro-3-hydroxyanthranilate isomerase
VVKAKDYMKILNCFCTDLPNSGNPAGVIFDFAGDRIEKQKLAQQRQLPVIVFIDQVDSDVPVLQFFYPNIETNLCLHGALAAVFLLMNQRRADYITVSNAVGTLLQAIKLDNQVAQIKVSAEPAPTYNPDQKMLKKLLNLDDFNEISTDLPMVVASVGSPKLFVPLRSTEALATLHPNFDLIKQWSLEHKINGLYVYTSESKDPQLLQARAFNPKTGQNEDAATGVAAAALALVFKKNLIIKQGHFINKPSQLMVTYRNSEEIYVGGKVIANEVIS